MGKMPRRQFAVLVVFGPIWLFIPLPVQYVSSIENEQGKIMIYEIRTYDLSARSTGEVIKRFEEKIEGRTKLSPLVGFWYTEIGPLNQIVHIWSYDSLDQRAEVRHEAVASGAWPPKIGEFVLKQNVEICFAWPFSPEMTPGEHGPYYEMRSYMVAPGKMPAVKASWEKDLPGRLEYSPCVGLLECDIGVASKMIHIWAYKSLDDRAKARKESGEAGVWPAPVEGGPHHMGAQDSKVMLPAPFSPMR